MGIPGGITGQHKGIMEVSQGILVASQRHHGVSQVGIPRWDSAFRRAALRPASLNCLRAPGFAPAVRSRGGTDSVLLGQAAIPTPLGAAVREAHGNRPVALWPVFESRMTINDSADRNFGLYRKHLLQIWILNSTGRFWPNLKETWSSRLLPRISTS